MTQFKGVFATPMTPFDDDGKPALDLIDPYIAWLSESGVRGVYVLGTWGGFALLDLDERRKVAEAYCAATKTHGMQLLVHIGSYAIKDAIELGHHAIDHGADAISSVVPQYYSTAEYLGLDDYRRYFTTLVDSLKAPLYLYNNPRTTGVLLSPSDFVTLCGVGLAGVKDGAKNVAWITQTQDQLAEAGLSAQIIPGNSIALVYGRLYGCDAVTSGAAVAFPAETAAIHAFLDGGDVGAAVAQHRYTLNLRKAMGLCPAPAAAAHWLLKSLGQDLGMPRAPWPTFHRELMDRIERAVKDARSEAAAPKISSA